VALPSERRGKELSMNQKLIPLVSVAVGVLAFLLTFQYLRAKEREVEDIKRQIYERARKIEVAGAARDIPEGTSVGRDDLKLIEVDEWSASDQVVRRDEGIMILGRKTRFQIKANKPILWSDIEGGEAVSQGLAPMVKPGLRALSLAIGGAAAVSGMVEPNDHVDVLGTFSLPSAAVPGVMESVTLTVLQDVTVLATGQQVSRQLSSARRGGARDTGYSTVTMEVTPREAELLVFAQQAHGRLTLVLRNPSDISFEKEMPNVDFKMLQTELPDLNINRQKHIRLKSSVE
jgi:pilus assembly protein CpaB